MRIGLATIAAGRPAHLRRQATAVGRLTGLVRYVVVAMDPVAPRVAGAQVLSLPAAPGELPLAAARNRAVAALADCELAILLDVDCIPSRDLLARYRTAAEALGARPALLCGPVGYLGEPDTAADRIDAGARRRARGRVIRDFPADGIRLQPRVELFWSLSFAVRPEVHRRIGGFDEGYVGWGAEDTDYGLRARDAGVPLWFVGGAWAYHQHHPSTPADQPERVLANARRFHRRWGFWPMPDRLAQLADAGAIDWTPEDADRSGVRARPAAGPTV